MQKELFENSDNKKPLVNNDFQWNQFIKLGDMMGDGLHHEPGGKWIVKEYNQLAKILVPELREQDKEKRKLKASRIDEQMIKLLANNKCSCGGNLKQKRAGTKVAYCEKCNNRYVASKKK